MIYCNIENGIVIGRIVFDGPMPEDWPDFNSYVQSDVAQIGWTYDGVFHAPAGPTPHIPDSSDVNVERQRRIGLPLNVVVPDIGSFKIDMTDQSRSNVTGLVVLAQLQLAQGNTSVMTTFRDADNVDHDLTPTQAIAIGVQAAKHVDEIYKKSWQIKAMDPIPNDFSDDLYWTIG